MGLQPELKSAIDKFIASNKVVPFMKGNKQFPQCGFSNTCVQASTVCSGQSANDSHLAQGEHSSCCNCRF